MKNLFTAFNMSKSLAQDTKKKTKQKTSKQKNAVL